MMRPTSRSALTLTLALSLAGGFKGEAALAAGSIHGTEERVVEASGGKKVRATFGRLTVPEVRSDPGSSKIDLAFVRLHSKASEPCPPVVYLAGGPGGSSTWQAEDPDFLSNWLGILEVADVILLDQRGTGRSEPSMRYRWEGELPLRAFADENASREHVLEMSRRARAALLERGIDPRGYTTVESADDVDALREALGEERISLFGFSYGTHLGLAVIRRHGERVASAVLAGNEGPDHTRKLPLNMDVAFQRLSRLVAADPRIGGRIPDLVALYDRVIAKLAAEPMVISIPGPGGESIELPIGPWGLNRILRWDIGDASDLPVFPRLLHSIDRGDPSVLSWFVRKRAGSAIGINGMSVLVDGASGATASRWQAIEEQNERSRFGRAVNFPFPDVNEVWQPLDLGDSFRGPLVSDVRTLFLSGTLDWNSPPQQAEEIRWGFSDSTHLVVDNAGHEQVLPHPEVQKAIVSFLRGEEVSDVRASWPPLRFVPLEGTDPEVTHPSVEG